MAAPCPNPNASGSNARMAASVVRKIGHAVYPRAQQALVRVADFSELFVLGKEMIVTEEGIFFFSEYESLGSGDEETLIQAGENRMRPIVMTTLAAILTLLPLAFAIGEGWVMQQPLAVAIISGLAVQLPLVLLVMPGGSTTLCSLATRSQFPSRKAACCTLAHPCHPS